MRTLSLAAVLSITAGTVLAGPLDKRVVPADVTWVLHVDVEAATSSTLGKFILAHRDQADLSDLAELKTKLGVDPTTDVRGLTVFGQLDEGEDAVLLIYSTDAFDGVLEKMTTENRVTREDVEGYALLTWEDEGEAHVGYIRPGPTPDSRLVYVSSHRDRLLTALRTLDRKGPSVADGNSVLKASPGAGSFIFIDAPEISGALEKAKQHGLGAEKNHGAEHMALLEKVRGVNVDLGESAQKLYASVTITSDTPENALNMVQTVQGFAALGRLMMSNEPDMAEALTLMNAIKITSEDRRVLLRASWSTDTVQRLLESAEQHGHDGDEDADADEAPKPSKDKGKAPKKRQGV